LEKLYKHFFLVSCAGARGDSSLSHYLHDLAQERPLWDVALYHPLFTEGEFALEASHYAEGIRLAIFEEDDYLLSQKPT